MSTGCCCTGNLKQRLECTVDKGYDALHGHSQCTGPFTCVASQFMDGEVSILNTKYNMTDKARPFDDLYTIGEKLGSGTFGDVFKVTSHDTGREYAMKREDRISENTKLRRRDEVKALKQCRHKNIVKYYVHSFK